MSVSFLKVHMAKSAHSWRNTVTQIYTQLLWWRQSFGSLFCGSSKGRYCWIWLTDQGLAGQMCLIRNGGIRKLCVCMTVRLKSQCGQPRLSSQKQKMSVLLKVWKEWAQQTITPRVSVSRNVRVLKWVTVSPFLMATGGNKFPCWKVHLKPAGRWFYMLCSLSQSGSIYRKTFFTNFYLIFKGKSSCNPQHTIKIYISRSII